MAATIKTIAQLAGVSRGTVDRVLNRRGGVNSETASRVTAIADKLSYKPNLVGKSLSTKGLCGRSIGVLLNAEGNPFFDDVLDGVAAKGAEIEDFGFHLHIEKLKGYDIDQQLEGIDKLVASGVSGLVLSPINKPPISAKLKELQAKHTPVVCLNTDVLDAPRVAYVGSDYKQCGRVAAGLFGLLAGDVPQKLALIVGSFIILGHNLRVQGFQECVKEELPHFEIVAMVENNDDDQNSYKATKAVLTQNPNLTGIFFSAAGIEGGLKALEDAGLLGNINVVSVDLIDVVKNHLRRGNITATVCQEPFKQGYEAVRVMFDLLLADKRPANDILTETQIMIRHSL